MLRISRFFGSRGTELRPEGQLVMENVGELDRLSRELVRSEDDWGLDLRFVTFVDRHGIALLRRLARAGARIEGASPFVAALLAEGARDEPPQGEAQPPAR